MQHWMIWLLVGIVLIVIEMATPGLFFFLCFGIGASLAALLAFFGFSQPVLWSAFIGSSIFLVLIARPLSKKFLKGDVRPSNIDEFIGKEALVTEPIAPHSNGTVKIRGEVWKAESAQQIPTGALVEVLKVEGTHLIVKKKENA